MRNSTQTNNPSRPKRIIACCDPHFGPDDFVVLAINVAARSATVVHAPRKEVERATHGVTFAHPRVPRLRKAFVSGDAGTLTCLGWLIAGGKSEAVALDLTEGCEMVYEITHARAREEIGRMLGG